MAIYVCASLFDVWFFLPSIAQPIALAATLLAAYFLTKTALNKANWGWQRDYGAKYIIIFAIASGFAIAQGQGLEIVINAFKINFYAPISQAKISAWVAPPNYTGTSHTNLAKTHRYKDLSENDNNLTMLEGSIVKFSIEGGIRKPRLYLNGKVIAFPPPYENTYQQTVAMYQTGELELNFGAKNTVVWNIEVKRDEVPSVGFTSVPIAQPDNTLEVGYVGQDDYPLRKITFQFRKAGQYGDDGDSEGQVFSHPLPLTLEQKSVERYQRLDLSANPWAGTMVLGWLNIEDAMGQVSTSDVLQFRLPQKTFSNPVARNIINIRKSLLLEPTPKAVLGQRLKLISENKDDINNDLVVYIALRTAYWRLSLSPSYDVDLIASLLWDTALRLEETTGETFAQHIRSTN